MNIIVTGASRGIGYELVKFFCADNTNTVIAIARNFEKLTQLKKECEQLHSDSKVIIHPCDLNSGTDIDRLVEKVKSEGFVIDVLINNAGALVNKPFLELTKADIERVYQVNVFSVMALIQNMLPLMNPNNKSHIVNISSVGGFQGSVKFAGLSAYSSSKAALACLTECLAEEFKETNVAFNCLALGAAQTEMLSEAFPGYKAPLSASKMAEFIAQFSINAHQYINGKIIPVSLSTP